MKIIKQGKTHEDCILNTIMEDEKNIVVIDTAILNNKVDTMFEGKDTTGQIEMMVSLNGHWLDITQRRYPTEAKALVDHKKIVEDFKNNGIKHIFNFNETSGGGYKETEEELKSRVK